MNNIKPSVLTIAGSDSGGGAGIQADLRSFNAFKVYGCSVITAVTAQNPFEVRRVDILPASSVRSQMESVLDAFPIRFAKTGMLANREIIECVAETAVKYDLQLIVDPVMVSTSGAALLEESAISAMRDSLFPLAKWITPNIPEAELICGRKLTSISDLADSAQMLYEKYKCNCLLKSGHAVLSDTVTDIVCYQGKLFALSSPAAEVAKNTAHGTGCTLSAALAANFASGKNFPEALMAAKAFVYGSLCESVNLRDSLAQMYPPAKNYMDQVKLKEL
ncbi:MAG: bifunctional hydroxymethylpyrimidine kinase/phosphomethylpyrimidine kinase [Lentisphaeria bacterium]|nr:bifunctional hydroxymethylpyrimidine kinase/phosphomethylpyrimidine kinase [Lentisphaeria bacterium]